MSPDYATACAKLSSGVVRQKYTSESVEAAWRDMQDEIETALILAEYEDGLAVRSDRQ